MRTSTTTLLTAGALATALLVTGCGGAPGNTADATGELVLQPAAARGPHPFTRSAATAPPPVTRTPQRDATAPRTVSGGTPGLYGGTGRVGSCDVERLIGDLSADRSRTGAFARIAGVSPASVPGRLRGLAPVVLRADTRVTDHGYRGGRASGHQAVLQAGTAVLVDDRGVPRVRCAGGSPLAPPVPLRGGAVLGGRPWPGYRPGQVIVVTPSEQVITDITIIDLVDHSWIERRIDHDCRHDHVLRPPAPPPPAPTGLPGDSTAPRAPAPHSPAPASETPPGQAAPACRPTTVLGTDESCPVPVAPPTDPDPAPSTKPDPDTEPGPDTVPDTPDLPDGGGLIPDDPEATTGAVPGTPAGVT
ncbi:hypothetical protein M2163_008104 [Streptomyces sp. SAI-135]|uniref:DUF6777 domain-containing protein n=1 Tax=unclassified Streptomyces TaxID=2593676 RepID=UPI002475528D|nr:MULTISPECIES: DUF6777 domain-containing protein [unclassified Streptomyces]MDH6514921.1 hypothetical protein [Streptomyces sp. SAI-090]MDH6620996.1 hypothetical protein [Streptomyces sp. SAI-135]